MSLSKNDPLVEIAAYCLMPNHFHLILKEIVDNGISILMQRLGTAYTMYFNKKYNRSGGLFTRPFRAKHIANDEYLKKVIEYIHMNPVELAPIKSTRTEEVLALKTFLDAYHFSSYLDYQGVARAQSVILTKATPW